jgi:hypothetical protein
MSIIISGCEQVPAPILDYLLGSVPATVEASSGAAVAVIVFTRVATIDRRSGRAMPEKCVLQLAGSMHGYSGFPGFALENACS